MIVIDAGHGGADPGAIGNGMQEKDYSLLISDYMFEQFKKAGVPVVMTRTDDETLSPTERVERILSAYGDDSDVIVISNHLNAGGGDGAEVIYALRNNDILSKLILENLEKTGITIRKFYQRRLPSDTSKDYYFIHRETGKTQPVLVEYGFIDNKENAEFIRNNYEEMAQAVVDAVLEYSGILLPTDENEYVVKLGDSLYSIARKYNTTVNELKLLNNLKSEILSIGQVIKIPSESNENVNTNYTVKSGDSLYSIAKKYNTTVNELKKLNNLKSEILTIDQVIKIPSASNENVNIKYTVKLGDSLYSIARKYNTTVNELKLLNNLKSEILSIGQVIKIPSESNDNVNTNYTVKSGDSLYSIARKYNTTVNELKKLNNLKSEFLSIGQVIKIPIK